MNFSQLVKTLVDYLDVGKRIATTIPGMALVFGFILLVSGPPELFQPARVAGQIQDQEAVLEQLREAAAGQQKAIDAATHQGELADETLALLDADRDKAGTAYKAAPNAANRAAFDSAQGALAAAWTAAKQKPQEDKYRAEARLRVANEAITTQTARLAALRQEYAAALGFTNALTSLFNIAILVGLVGFAAGMLLEPINRALFLQFVPALGESRGERARYLTGYYLTKPPATQQTRFPIHYYIGRGLITQVEYDDLVASVYRLSEVTVGMIVPVIVITAGLLWRWATLFGTQIPGGFLVRLQQAAVIVAAAALVWFLFRVGLKRYGEFRKQVYALIEGREAAFDEQRRQAEREAIAVQQAAAIRELKDVVRQLKGTDGQRPDGGALEDLPLPAQPTPRRGAPRGRS